MMWLMSLLRVYKALCLPQLKSITVLLYDFSTMNKKFLIEFMFNLKSFSHVLETIIKIF